MSLPQYLSLLVFTLFIFMTLGPVVIFSVHNGLKMVLNAKKINGQNSNYEVDISLATLYRRGFFMTLTNPKAFAYLMAVIPQFLMGGHDLIPQLLIMAPTIATAQFLCIGSYVMFAHQFRE